MFFPNTRFETRAYHPLYTGYSLHLNCVWVGSLLKKSWIIPFSMLSTGIRSQLVSTPYSPYSGPELLLCLQNHAQITCISHNLCTQHL